MLTYVYSYHALNIEISYNILRDNRHCIYENELLHSSKR